MARTVSQGEDGFWRVSGEPADNYYLTRAESVRVAANLDAADVPTSSQPATQVSEGQQNAALGPADATITTAVVTPGAGGTQAATVQLKDAAGANLGSKTAVRWWLSAAGAALGAVDAGAIATAPTVTTGVAIDSPHTYNGVALTDSTGKVVIRFAGSAPARFNISCGRLSKAAAADFVDQTPS
ncbi:MAG TPA: hypothetical protein VFQ87_03180 [Bradyrhizobium sp.]|jgi:hypothetical protein|nr:hypothetical protein [Bradyrhizobium sp.]